MRYNVEIDGLSDYPGYRNIITRDEGELARYRREAAENARKAMPEWERDNDGEHLVYYYELPRKKDTQNVVVLMKPQAVTDEFFQRFVDGFKPEYVGAIHRKMRVDFTPDREAVNTRPGADETPEGRND